MTDKTQKTSERKHGRLKKGWLKNYVLICVIFLATVTMSTFFIRSLYMSIHIEEVTKEAKGVTEYAKGRLLAYEAFDRLVDFWTSPDFTDLADEKKKAYLSEHDVNEWTDITAEDMETMSPDEITAFGVNSYKDIADDFDLIYQKFDINQLYCVKYTADKEPQMLFWGDINDLHNLELPTFWDLYPIVHESYEKLAGDPYIVTGTGRITKTKIADTMTLRFTLLVSSTEDTMCVLIWDRDWSDVLREINLGALKFSVFTSALLIMIGLIVLRMYRKYETERLRVGIEQERSRAELRICRKIQLSQLPDPATEFPEHLKTDVSVFVQPAKEVGGDFCDCFMIGENRVGLVIADVSDKGLPAAMFMMMAKSLIRSEMKQGSSPGQVMKKVSEQLSDHNDAGMFVTVWLAEIDLVTGECVSVNAGHENPAVKRNGGNWEMLRYPHDMPAAILKEADYTEHMDKLAEGDMIFVYTDGVTDAEDPQGGRFGEDRITESLNAAGSEDPQAVIDGLFARISSFSEGTEQFDDIGMVCFKYSKRDKEE